ncbi:FkbM family methyltransferase [Ottowia thiooxydans]|uniref:FkbM family methyltransferase n=1 Tax=Ottowia thiooxydans TaxID=219182 RepID=UPI000424E1F9|nr:FkbM family methyltransferase [Ottowia thiooxydans]
MTQNSQFVSRLLGEINRLRHHLIAEPVIDHWLAVADPPIPRTLHEVDHFVALVTGAEDRWTRLADRLDTPSREILLAILLYRSLGYQRYNMPWATELQLGAVYGPARSATVGPAGGEPIPPWPMLLFDFEYFGSQLNIEAWLGNIAATFTARQYYHPEVHIQPGDVVIDGGGCFGDTALAFAAEAGPEGRVISFEPNASNLKILHRNLARNPELADRVTVLERAISDQPERTLSFMAQGAASYINSDGDGTVRTETLDRLVEDGRVDRIDFIKMDIEAHEGAALRGARQVLREFKPRLAIAAYHRSDDLLALSELILELQPAYQLRLGHITTSQSETVLFAA